MRPSTSCFPGYAISSPTASTTAPTCMRHSPDSANGPSRSSNARLALLAFNCCRAAGSSNEPWLGSIETAAWPRISRLRSPAPKPGFTSPPCSSSFGDWLDHNAIYKDEIQPIRLRYGHLIADKGHVHSCSLSSDISEFFNSTVFAVHSLAFTTARPNDSEQTISQMCQTARFLYHSHTLAQSSVVYYI